MRTLTELAIGSVIRASYICAHRSDLGRNLLNLTGKIPKAIDDSAGYGGVYLQNQGAQAALRIGGCSKGVNDRTPIAL